MAITRSQYITVAELNEILGVTTYTNTILPKIYEASEAIKNYCFRFPMLAPMIDYTTTTAPDALKLATAFQVQYAENNPELDNEYAGTSRSIGIGATNESVNYGASAMQEYRKISPKTIRYLKEYNLMSRIL